MLLALLIAAQTYGPQHLPPVTEAEDPLVDAAAVVRGLIVELAYAKEDNIAGRALYPPDAKCLLRRSVAQRLALAADALRKQGLRLVARDCTRSPESQRVLWRAYPQAGAVADPSRGSLHARECSISATSAQRPAAAASISWNCCDGSRTSIPVSYDADQTTRPRRPAGAR